MYVITIRVSNYFFYYSIADSLCIQKGLGGNNVWVYLGHPSVK